MLLSLKRAVLRIKTTEVLKFIVAAALGFTFRVMIETSQTGPLTHSCVQSVDSVGNRLDINSMDVQLREQYQPQVPGGVIEYRFLDLNNVFDSHGAWPKHPLKEYHLRDLKDALTQAMNYLNSDGHQFKLKTLHSGYERIDPLRGKEYLFDVEVQSASATRPGFKNDELFRVSMVKPFSTPRVLRRVHVAKLPPGSINLVVAMHLSQYNAFLRFMDIYENFVGRKRLGVTLSFAVFHDEKNPQHKLLSDRLTKYLEKVKKRAAVPNTVRYRVFLRDGKYLPYVGRDLATKDLSADSNVVFTDLNVNLTSDFYFRCEATIQSGEATGDAVVYAPIPYSLFRLTDMTKAVPDILPPIDRETGYWDHSNLQTFCMKKSAYQLAGAYDVLNSNSDNWSENDKLYGRFVKHKVKIIRSVDPAVFVSYHELHCNDWVKLGYMSEKKCRELHLKSVGTRTMIAERLPSV